MSQIKPPQLKLWFLVCVAQLIARINQLIGNSSCTPVTRVISQEWVIIGDIKQSAFTHSANDGAFAIVFTPSHTDKKLEFPNTERRTSENLNFTQFP